MVRITGSCAPVLPRPRPKGGWTKSGPKHGREAAAEDSAEGAFVDVAEVAPEPDLPPAPEPEPEPAPALAEAVEPDLVVEPVREIVQVVEDPVFTLESFGNEPVPGEAEARAGVEPEAAIQPEIQPDTKAEDQGQVWTSKPILVNVRAEPLTEAEILWQAWQWRGAFAGWLGK